MQDIFDLVDDREDLPDEEIFECYNCNWVGGSPVSLGGPTLFDTVDDEDELRCCPICGELIE